MCKDRIENGTIKLKGVKYVNWDIMSSNVSLIYNSKKNKSRRNSQGNFFTWT